MLDKSQRKVAKGMLAGFVLACLVVFIVPAFIHFDKPTSILLTVLLPIVTLAIAIARLARHRFFSAEDIAGSGLTQGSERAKVLQSLLQNTLEQTVLALPIYLSAVALYPNTLGQAAICAALCFLVGRLLFFYQYRYGAGARALGFTLTFYPTLLLIGWLLVKLVLKLA